VLISHTLLGSICSYILDRKRDFRAFWLFGKPLVKSGIVPATSPDLSIASLLLAPKPHAHCDVAGAAVVRILKAFLIRLAGISALLERLSFDFHAARDPKLALLPRKIVPVVTRGEKLVTYEVCKDLGVCEGFLWNAKFWVLA
jgi:hypothetical protein